MRIFCCDGKIVGLNFQLLQFSKVSRWHIRVNPLPTLISQTLVQKLGPCPWQLPIYNGNIWKYLLGQDPSLIFFLSSEELPFYWLFPISFHERCPNFTEIYWCFLKTALTHTYRCKEPLGHNYSGHNWNFFSSNWFYQPQYPWWRSYSRYRFTIHKRTK